MDNQLHLFAATEIADENHSITNKKTIETLNFTVACLNLGQQTFIPFTKKYVRRE